MLKTNKFVSLLLAIVLVVSMCTVAITSTSALADGEIHVVAGADGLCGSAWDPADTNNQMTWVEDKGIYEKVFTDVAAGTYEFKVTTNYGWDNGDFNLEGDAMFGGANATVTVDVDGSTVIVGFDGTKALVEVKAGEPVVAANEIIVNGEATPVNVGDVWSYYFYLNAADVAAEGCLTSLEGSTFYDESKLKVTNYVMDSNRLYTDMFPTTASIVVPNTKTNEVTYNFVALNGVPFDNDERVLVKIDFEVIAEGSSEIDTKIINAEDLAGTKLIEDGVFAGDAWKETEKLVCKSAAPTEPVATEPVATEPVATEPVATEPVETEPVATEPVATEPVPTTPAEPEGLFVKADGVLYEVEQGETYTYTYYLNVPNAKIGSFDATTYYDVEGLEVCPTVDEWGDADTAAMFPVFGAATINNFGVAGKILFNYSSTGGVRFPYEDSVAMTVDFKVTAESGIYEINTIIAVMADTNLNKYVFDCETLNDAFTDKEVLDAPVYVPSTEPVATEPVATEPVATEPVATEPVATEPIEPENFYVAAGDDTLFGSIWDPADRANELIFNADKGVYEKVYENVAAGTYQFKVTTNGAWDIGDYNLEGDAMYGGANAVAEVLYDGATVTIGFDGTKALLDIAYADVPSTEPVATEPVATEPVATEPTPAHNLFVRADGVYYAVEQGQTYRYTYYLNVPNAKIGSFDATTYYDAEGLEICPMVDEWGDPDTAAMFPIFGAATINNMNIKGQVLFNYSSTGGVRFPAEDSVAFTVDFKVTAEEGVYDINTMITVMADATLNKYVFDGVVLNDAFTEKEVLDAEVYEGEIPTEPVATEPVATEPVATEPVATEPVATEPVATEPVATEPVATEPIPTQPIPTEPVKPTEPVATEPVATEPVEDETTADDDKKPATTDQSSTNDQKQPTNKAPIKTGSTTTAIAFLTVLVMAAGVVMIARKRKFD